LLAQKAINCDRPRISAALLMYNAFYHAVTETTREKKIANDNLLDTNKHKEDESLTEIFDKYR